MLRKYQEIKNNLVTSKKVLTRKSDTTHSSIHSFFEALMVIDELITLLQEISLETDDVRQKQLVCSLVSDGGRQAVESALGETLLFLLVTGPKT